MIQLSQPDFQHLAYIVQNLPDFANVRDRRRLVAGALEGAPRGDTVLARLDLDGSPMSVSADVVRSLARFGQVAYGKEALGVFLNYIRPFVGDEDSNFIASLFEIYPLAAAVSTERNLDHWRGRDSVADVQEKIVGENTLRHLYVLELALDAGRAVVHLRVTRADGRAASGTGFMIASDLLMTNHHVITTASEAESTTYSFNYQLDRMGQLCEPLLARALPGGHFHTNQELDYTVVQLDAPPDYGSLALRAVQMRKDDRVTIIQHPGGHLKQISMQNNFVAYADTQIVQYTTSTLPGSSGSPVFDDAMEVVAVHHSGGMLMEPGTSRYYLRNAGTSMIAILDDLTIHAPKIRSQLKG
jgi:V8-like Glu-specific endopeptidase